MLPFPEIISLEQKYTHHVLDVHEVRSLQQFLLKEVQIYIGSLVSFCISGKEGMNPYKDSSKTLESLKVKYCM